ncbi:MAG: hypothetical protein IJY71_06300 [Clostridia bacterium]|nr:hypothetical protein [Clostridia bacterium]
MKKQNTPSNPYATNSIAPIAAPRKPENEPKGTVHKGEDLRAGRKSK